MIENEGKVVKVKEAREGGLVLDVILNGKQVTLNFSQGDLMEKPLAYDEPWIYSFISQNSPDGKTYSINALFFGNPNTNLDFAELEGNQLEEIGQTPQKTQPNLPMKKQPKINPVGLKGNEINERMRTLMGIGPINENKNNIVVELTKIGPDGMAYAVIRENHEWYIKKADKTKGLVAEDFKYIGGLMNKKAEAYPSYAKAIKHLNLKFKSLAEAYNFEEVINVFENDNLLSEDVAGFSSMKGLGFNGGGNLEGNKPIEEVTLETEDGEVEMSEAEKAVDAMLEEEKTEETSAKYEDGSDVKKDTKVFIGKPKDEPIKEGKLSIDQAMKTMDSFIDLLTTGLKKKV